MSNYVEQVVSGVTAWDGVSISPHRFGGTEFNLGKVEIGHIHRNGMVDIPFTRAIRAQLLIEDRAEPHHLLPETGWISFYIHTAADVEQALWLLRLSYLHKAKRRLIGVDVAHSLDDLKASDGLRALVVGVAVGSSSDDDVDE